MCIRDSRIEAYAKKADFEIVETIFKDTKSVERLKFYPSFVSDHFLSGGRGVSLRTSAAFLLLIFHVHISAVNFLPVSDYVCSLFSWAHPRSSVK